MWMAQHYEFLHRLAWYLSLSVSLLVVGFLGVAFGIRLWRDRVDARRKRLRAKWRDRFEAWMSDSELEAASASSELLSASFFEQRMALESWSEVLGGASRKQQKRLVRLGERMRLNGIAHDHLAGSLEDKLVACRIFGYLDHEVAREELESFGWHDNPYLATAAHEALIRQDPDGALPNFMEYVNEHRDVGFHFVARVFERLGDASISGPLTDYVGRVDLRGREWLLLLLEFADPGSYRELLGTILENSKNPELISNALRLLRRIGTAHGKAGVLEHLDHPVWFVRLQAATTLGAIGDSRDAEHLIPLLGDPEWWVRYRAAQALETLTESTPEDLQRLRNTLSDEYARDILIQVMAE